MAKLSAATACFFCQVRTAAPTTLVQLSKPVLLPVWTITRGGKSWLCSRFSSFSSRAFTRARELHAELQHLLCVEDQRGALMSPGAWNSQQQRHIPADADHDEFDEPALPDRPERIAQQHQAEAGLAVDRFKLHEHARPVRPPAVVEDRQLPPAAMIIAAECRARLVNRAARTAMAAGRARLFLDFRFVDRHNGAAHRAFAARPPRNQRDIISRHGTNDAMASPASPAATVCCGTQQIGADWRPPFAVCRHCIVQFSIVDILLSHEGDT